ncbi:MAG: hypothetical protein IM638_08430 [Bacteroidetes bacterium]|nr:hypothetical protein [Bacteroidota bacterium]
MRHYTFFVLLIFPFLFQSSNPAPARVQTWLNGHVERWDVEIGDKKGEFEIGFKNDPNSWRYISEGKEVLIETYFKDHFNHWQFTMGSQRFYLETQMPGSWTRWQLSGDSLKMMRIETFYGQSWDNWNFNAEAGRCQISTRIHNRFEDWEISGPHDKLSEGERVAALFLPVLIGRIQQKGLFTN